MRAELVWCLALQWRAGQTVGRRTARQRGAALTGHSDRTLLVTGWPSTGFRLNLPFLSLHLGLKVNSLLASTVLQKLLPMQILSRHYQERE